MCDKKKIILSVTIIMLMHAMYIIFTLVHICILGNKCMVGIHILFSTIGANNYYRLMIILYYVFFSVGEPDLFRGSQSR